MKNTIKPICFSSAVLISGFLAIASSCGGEQTTGKEGPAMKEEQKVVKVIHDIPYRDGESESWRLDLAAPENFGEEIRPAIVIIHGGGWRAGSKQNMVYRNLLIHYAFQGYVTLSVEYRFDQEAAFPACVEDVKCAVRWLRAHAGQYSVDPDRIGAYGHSAGAHLALMLAMCPPSAGLEGDGGWDEYSSMVNAVAGGSTPTQIGARHSDWGKPEWWPIGYISEDVPPMLLIHGVDDPIVKVELVDDFVEKLKAAGARDLTYIREEGAHHGIAYDQKLDITQPAMDAFFARTLRPGGEQE